MNVESVAVVQVVPSSPYVSPFAASFMSAVDLRVGDVVEIRSREEILSTLDEKGCLENLPFMPEMFAFCGQRYRVYKRAHKTCDTVNDCKDKGRRMKDAVHLEGIRCDGQAHGGCEASCLIFWKVAWLRKIEPNQENAETSQGMQKGRRQALPSQCAEADVWAATQRPGMANGEPAYVCQATQVPAATNPLPWWNWRQYVE